jgi:Zn-dependent peptidase ImmA (M78 family)
MARIIMTQDDEMTLSPECEDVFEAEANYGAADIVFQCERFEKEARDYELSLESALHLRKKYDASCHATLRRFVERNHRPCLLMILTPTLREHADGQKS